MICDNYEEYEREDFIIDVDVLSPEEELININDEPVGDNDFCWEDVEDFIDKIISLNNYSVEKETVEAFCNKYRLSENVREDVYAALDDNKIEVMDEYKKKPIDLDIEETTATNIFYREIAQYKLLDADEERRYLEAMINDKDTVARETLICHNLRLVLDIARKYYKKNPSVELTDIISAGTTGLMTAIDRFELDKKNKLSTYATWWIRAYIEDYLASNMRAFRITVGTNKKISKIFYFRNLLSTKNNKEPSVEELAAACELPISEVRKLLTLALPAKSLNAEINEEGLTLNDFIGEEDCYGEEEKKEIRRKNALLAVIQEQFDEREQKILINRYGLSEDENRFTLKDIGASLGITSERTRQIETRALIKLRHPKNVKKLNGIEI